MKTQSHGLTLICEWRINTWIMKIIKKFGLVMIINVKKSCLIKKRLTYLVVAFHLGVLFCNTKSNVIGIWHSQRYRDWQDDLCC